MFLEYKEEVNMLKTQREVERSDQDLNQVPMSQEEIDEDYENLENLVD
jgi:hypothetical protein